MVPHLSISPVPVKDLAGSYADWRAQYSSSSPCAFGAEICFEGVVRGIENDRLITGIEYSCYEPMVIAELDRVAATGQERFGDHPLYIHHVTGFVKEGEPSIVIRVYLPHSKEAFDACQWYLAAMKKHIPIWKRAIFYEPTQ